jgi:purine nucleoside permease
MLAAALAGAFFCIAGRVAQAAEYAPKVVIVVYFEVGNDTGDTPGELQTWVERDHLTQRITVPGMTRAVRANADGSEIAVAVGPGEIRPAVNVMALGNDPRFDFTASYWLINGIAGVSPHDAPLNSAFWTDYVINGDFNHMLDAREIPAAWPDGFVALHHSTPFEAHLAPGDPNDARTWPPTGAHIDAAGSIVRLNPHLLRWAYSQTKDMKLAVTPEMRAAGARFAHDPNASRAPRVEIGANLATEGFWHGAKLDAWAHRWVPYMTGGGATYKTTAENDSGTLVALYALTKLGRADWNRALLLRTCSNFDMQPDGRTAAQSLHDIWHGGFDAYLPSLRTAYDVGHRIAALILAGRAERI